MEMFQLLDPRFELLDYVGFVSHLFCKQHLPGMMNDCVHALEVRSFSNGSVFSSSL